MRKASIEISRFICLQRIPQSSQSMAMTDPEASLRIILWQSQKLALKRGN
jgi:hypothetical protein